MAEREKDPDILHRLDKENARRGGVNAGKIMATRPEGYRRWPWWQKWIVVGAIVAVFCVYLFIQR